jgi:NAD+ kinase
LNKNIKKVGVFLRPNKPELLSEYKNIKRNFESYGIKVEIEDKSAEMIGLEGISTDQLLDEVDILISFGGDGTLLSTVRKSFHINKPILPINGGTLGFLAGLNTKDLHKFIKDLIDGKFKTEKRKILRINYNNSVHFALNDLLITKPERVKMSKIHVYVDNHEKNSRDYLNSYYGDALIISTPTGSTAYNLSSGGPILHPEMSSYILTPIAPHSLTQRPIVLAYWIDIFVELEEDGIIVIDGQKIINIKEKKGIKISIDKRAIEIIRVENYNFFETLRDKLKWGD